MRDRLSQDAIQAAPSRKPFFGNSEGAFLPSRRASQHSKRYSLSQVIGLLLEGLQPPLILLDVGQDSRLGSRRDLIPKFSRNRRNRRHASILRPLQERTSQG